MAEDEVETPEGEETEEAKPSGKKKWIIIGAGAFLILLLAGGGAFFMLSGGEEDATTKAEGSEATAGEDETVAQDQLPEDKTEGEKEEQTEEASKEAEGADFGKTFTLKPFHLNLGNPLENRYIRLELSVEYRGGEQQKTELEARLPQLRDAVITITSRKTMEFLLGPDGKHQLRHEILVRFNEVLDKKVQSVFITDMLIE